MHYRNHSRRSLEHLQKMDIITPLRVDELVEWCNSFVLAPKANSEVRAIFRPSEAKPSANKTHR